MEPAGGIPCEGVTLRFSRHSYAVCPVIVRTCAALTHSACVAYVPRVLVQRNDTEGPCDNVFRASAGAATSASRNDGCFVMSMSPGWREHVELLWEDGQGQTPCR